MKKSLPCIVVAAALLASPAFAIDVKKTQAIPAAPITVWKTIGDFCGIQTWHPAVEKCVLSKKGADIIRTLSLKGGGTIVEKQTKRDDKAMTYSYTILESPLPVANYNSSISVGASGGGSMLTWLGRFDAKGADDAKASEVIGGIYDAGIKGIADKAK